MSDGYTKSVTYTFFCGDERWEVCTSKADYMYIKETRNNGQEDVHISFDLHLRDGKWVFVDDFDAREGIETYRYAELADELLAFVNKHGRPGR